MVCFFIGSYLNGILDTAGVGKLPEPVLWVATYIVFLALNIKGVALSFRVTLVVTLASLAILVVFWFSAFPAHGFRPLGAEHRRGWQGAAGRPWFLVPVRFRGRTEDAAVRGVLFLAIEQLPLAAKNPWIRRRTCPAASSWACAR